MRVLRYPDELQESVLKAIYFREYLRSDWNAGYSLWPRKVSNAWRSLQVSYQLTRLREDEVKEHEADVYIIPDTDVTRELRWRAETRWPAPVFTGTEVFPAAMVKKPESI